MFFSQSNINPIVSDSNPALPNFIYFALESVKGGVGPSFPWATILYIAINPITAEYNDVITCRLDMVKPEVIASKALPEEYLLNLIRLSNNPEFLDIQDNSLYRFGVSDGGGQAIEYHINGNHKRLWCYYMKPLDGGPIYFTPNDNSRYPIPFYTGIIGTRSITDPAVRSFYGIEESEPIVRGANTIDGIISIDGF